VADGTYLNIRSFSLPYGDYRGSFRDNPFVLRVTQKPMEGPPGNYMKETENAFREIARQGGGDLVYASGPDDLVDRIRTVLENEKGKSVDIVLCLDTTASMKGDIDAVRRMLIPMLENIIAGFAGFRIGMVLYKDYFDEYLNRVVPFTNDFAAFQRNLNSIQVRGGGDTPEAVYEALHEGAIKFPWEQKSRIMILIGDAPPHLRQRGRISKDMVDKAVEERGIKVSAIILPQ
jgi:Mg-chelatase subunit ChlD